MGLQQYKALILIVFAVSALLVASPALQQLVVAPPLQPLTELALLGAFHNATYPYNATAGATHRLYIDVTNRLGRCAYYTLEMKFANETQSMPNSFNHTGSELPALGNLTLVVANGRTVELPLDITFLYSVDENISDTLDMQAIILNGVSLNANTTSIAFNPVRGGFFGYLFFELWVYNDTDNIFQYHQRYVSLWLEMVV